MARSTHIFGRRLAQAREALALTQRQLGEAIGGVSDETISRIERHEVAGILTKRLPALAATFGITLEEFKEKFCAPEPPKNGDRSTAITTASPLPSGLDLRRVRPTRNVPEFQIGVAASRRVEKYAEHPDANRTVATADRRAFAAPVDGDCQAPKWKHGEVVVFSYDAADREGIVPGNSYYLAFIDGSTTFKRVFLDDKDPDVYVLRCWNRKKYPADQRVHREEVVRIARAVSKQIAVDESGE